MPKFVGVNYLRFDDTFFVRITQNELDEARDLIKMIHDCLRERMDIETNYEQIPQNLCKWCSYWNGNGGPCDAEPPKWVPKKSTWKKGPKPINVKLDDLEVDAAMVQEGEEGEKNTVWDD